MADHQGAGPSGKRRRKVRAHQRGGDLRHAIRGRREDLQDRIRNTDLGNRPLRILSPNTSSIGHEVDLPRHGRLPTTSPDLANRLQELANTDIPDVPRKTARPHASKHGQLSSGCSATSVDVHILSGRRRRSRRSRTPTRRRKRAPSCQDIAADKLHRCRLADATVTDNHLPVSRPCTPFGGLEPVYREDTPSDDEEYPFFNLGLFDPSDKPVGWINAFHDLIVKKGIYSLRQRYRVMLMYLPEDILHSAVNHFDASCWWPRWGNQYFALRHWLLRTYADKPHFPHEPEDLNLRFTIQPPA